MAFKNFEVLAQAVWAAPNGKKLEAVLLMIEETVSSIAKKQSLRRDASTQTECKLDRFAANLMLFNGDAVLK